jgi:CheY-like chemotaxis protein
MSNKAIKILLVEDNSGDARLLREMFKRQTSQTIELTHVECMNDAEKHLAKHEFDIVLLHLGLPDAQGLGAVRRSRRKSCKKVRRTISSKGKSRRARCCEPCAMQLSARFRNRCYSRKRSVPKSRSTASATPLSPRTFRAR